MLVLPRGSILTYEFKRGFATPINFIFDLRRNVPYFYDTFWVEKITHQIWLVTPSEPNGCYWCHWKTAEQAAMGTVAPKDCEGGVGVALGL